VAGRAPSRVFDVEVAPDGTPWATVQDHRGEARAVLQLQKIPAGAAAPVVVASWPARNYASPSSIWRGIAVDRAGANAYVLDAPGTGGDWDVTVTPIALATGTVGPAIPVATNAEPHGIVLSTDDRELYVAGQTLDGNPFLWTLG
jgi:DNA-binding beta-propeller fold protein YncE